MLCVDEMELRIRRHEFADRHGEKVNDVADDPGRIDVAWLGHPFEAAANVTRSIPSSSLPLMTLVPLSTRGRLISRL